MDGAVYEISKAAESSQPFTNLEIEMKYFSMFSGIGTGEKGIEQAYDHQYESAFTKSPNGASGRKWVANIGDGSLLSPDHTSLRNAECVGFSEIDKHAEAVYRYHYDHRNYGDATRIVPDELPDFDFLIAGFPCQAFSIAGKRRGFDEARGTLFFEIARILSHKRPAHFLLENVKGLSSHDDGRTIIRIHSILSGFGYRVERVLLNSKDYGVPQNRERVFFIGHLGDGCSGEILSVGGDDQEVIELSGQLANTLTARYFGAQAVGTYVAEREFDAQGIIQVNSPTHSNERVYGCSGLAPTLNTMQGGHRQPFVAVTETRTDEAKRIRRESQVNGKDFSPRRGKELQMRNDGLTNTVTASPSIEMTLTDGYRIRRLTPTECERIQGLPDGYTKLGRYGDEVREVSDTQRYKGLGNSFTVNVFEAIVSRMIQKGCIDAEQ